MKRKLLLATVVAIGAVAIPATMPSVNAEGTTIRLASLAPRGSSWDRVFRAWDNTLKKKTNNAVKFRFYQGGVAGDERDVIRKMKVGQMDAGGLTSIGLGQISRPITLLQMPGIFDDYAQFNRVREKMSGEFGEMFEREGYKLLGWGDAGFGRIFSQKPILKPSDYKSVRPWVPREDPALPEMMKIIGANGIPLGIPEVLPALQTGMIDTVLASAIAAVALQWFRHTTHLSADANTSIVGATLIRKEVFDKLAPDSQEALIETGRQAHAQLIKVVTKEDEAAHQTLLKRGMKEFDPMQDPKNAAEWEKVNAEMLKRLTGRLWPKELLDKVKKVASET